MAVGIVGYTPRTSIAAQDIGALKQVFATIDADSCPYVYNFHMHTVCSDGQLEPEQLIEQAIAIGLRGLAITDHHSVAGYRRAQHWLDQQCLEPSQAPHLWTGVEISADLLGTEVHILCYGFDPDHEAMIPYLQGHSVSGSQYHAASVITAAHTAGALVVLAHPDRYRAPADQLIAAASHLGIDGVETYYAYNNPSPWIPSPQQTAAMRSLQTKYNLLGTCGTDSHGSSLLKRV